MSDDVAAVVGALFIGGLFVAYFMQQRAKRLARDAALRPPAPPPAPLAPAEAPATEALATEALASEGPESRPSSPAFGMSFLYTMLLFAAGTHLGSWWGYLWQALFAGLLLLGIGMAFGRDAYESARVYDPTRTRAAHMLINGVPYVLLPVVGYVIVIRFQSLWGLLAPGVIFIGLLAATYAIEVVDRWRGPKL